MGPVNLLPGVVAARRQGGLVAIDMEGLTLPAQALGPPPAMGEEMLLCLRPEQVRLFGAPRPDSMLSGLFKGYRQVSGHRLMVVSLPTGREILCDDPQAEQFAIGSRVFIWWDTAQVALLSGEDESHPAPDVSMSSGKEAPLCAP